MADSNGGKISFETMLEEAKRFEAEVIAVRGQGSHRPSKRQRILMCDLEDLTQCSMFKSWRSLLDHAILAPFLPVYPNLDVEGAGPIDRTSRPPDNVTIDSRGFACDPT